jgi:hypothetical protein
MFIDFLSTANTLYPQIGENIVLNFEQCIEIAKRQMQPQNSPVYTMISYLAAFFLDFSTNNGSLKLSLVDKL